MENAQKCLMSNYGWILTYEPLISLLVLQNPVNRLLNKQHNRVEETHDFSRLTQEQVTRVL